MPELFLGTLEEVPKKARTSVKNQCYYLVLPRVYALCLGTANVTADTAASGSAPISCFRLRRPLNRGGRVGGGLGKSPPTLNACVVKNHKQNVHNIWKKIKIEIKFSLVRV